MDRQQSGEALVMYICWDCGRDFNVAEHDGLTDSLEVVCPACGSDLVAVDFAAVRRRRPHSPHCMGGVGDRRLPTTGEAC